MVGMVGAAAPARGLPPAKNGWSLLLEPPCKHWVIDNLAEELVLDLFDIAWTTWPQRRCSKASSIGSQPIHGLTCEHVTVAVKKCMCLFHCFQFCSASVGCRVYKVERIFMGLLP